MTYPDDNDPQDYMPQAPAPAKTTAAEKLRALGKRGLFYEDKEGMSWPLMPGVAEEIAALLEEVSSWLPSGPYGSPAEQETIEWLDRYSKLAAMLPEVNDGQ